MGICFVNNYLTVKILFTYLLILCINCAYVIIMFNLSVSFETVTGCTLKLRIFEKLIQTFIKRPNQTGQKCASIEEIHSRYFTQQQREMC